MGLGNRVGRFVSGPRGRELAIRLRLLRAALSPRARRAERRAEVLLISYPKCGRTWLTMLLARTLARHAGVGEVDYLANDILGGRVGDVPHIRISHDDNPHWKTPARLARSKRRYRSKRVILLVRDPRDVVVSMYFERTRRERAYEGSLDRFLHEPKGSLDTIVEYYNIWSRERARLGGFLLVRYEDLRADTRAELERIVRFVGLERVADAILDDAVEFASFENMHAMEARDELKSGRLRPRDRNDAESFKTRKGKVGGFVDYLSEQEIAWMDQRIRERLDPCYGYGLSAAVRPPAARPAPVPAEVGSARQPVRQGDPS
jgi:hypothetical protein